MEPNRNDAGISRPKAITALAAIFIVTSFAPFPNSSEPELFQKNIISTGDYESHPCFSPDGKTMYFVKSSPNFSFWTIVVSHLKNGKWTAPEVANFSGKWSDADPYITPDGKKMYFISNRPANDNPKSNMDIWMMEWTGKDWGPPINPGAPVNSQADEWFPRTTKTGRLYFGSGREGGKGRTDIYFCEMENWKWSNLKNAGDSINTNFDEFEPLIDYDEKYLILMSARTGGVGRADFYLSWYKDGNWTKAINLGNKVNSPGTEIGATFSPDGKYFFFSSTREVFESSFEKKLSHKELVDRLNAPGNGLGDIYRIDLDAVLKN